MKLNHMFLLAWLSDNLATVAKYIVFFVLFILFVRWCRQPVETTVPTVSNIPQTYDNTPTVVDSTKYYEVLLPQFSEDYKINTGDIYRSVIVQKRIKGAIYDPSNTSRDLNLALYHYISLFTRQITIENGEIYWSPNDQLFTNGATFKIVDGNFVKTN